MGWGNSRMHLEAMLLVGDSNKTQSWLTTRGRSTKAVRVTWGVFNRNRGVYGVTLRKTENSPFVWGCIG